MWEMVEINIRNYHISQILFYYVTSAYRLETIASMPFNYKWLGFPMKEKKRLPSFLCVFLFKSVFLVKLLDTTLGSSKSLTTSEEWMTV